MQAQHPRECRFGARSRLVLVALLSLGTIACDLVVASGEETLLANGGQVFGSSGDGVAVRPIPAVRVEQAGRLIVADASVFGGSVVMPQVQTGSFVPPAAPGVRVLGGSVRVTGGGFVRGGVVALQSLANAFLGTGSGIDALGGFVSVEPGATVVGGDVTPRQATRAVSLGSGVVIRQGFLIVSGGTIRGGMGNSVLAGSQIVTEGASVAASEAFVLIAGGDVGSVFSTNSTTRVTGGAVGSIGADGGCVEIRGGSVGQLRAGGTDVRIVGSGFNLPLGPVALTTAPIRIQGTLESGVALDLLVVDSDLRTIERTSLQLVLPGSAGCSAM